MLNIGTGEIIFIAVAALLILGPQKLPEFARTIGKLVRDFRRQTDDVRATVEREFYKMDAQLTELPDPVPQPAPHTLAQGTPETSEAALPAGDAEPSQVMKGAPASESVAVAPAPVEPPTAAELPGAAPEPGKSQG